MLMLSKMLVLFLLIAVGYIAARKRIIPSSGIPILSAIVVNVANPALILSGSIGATTRVPTRNFITAMLAAVFLYGVLILVAYVTPKILGATGTTVGAYRIMTVFSNIGFMGFPVIYALYGSEGILYGTLFLIVYNVLIYTYGIWVIQAAAGEVQGFQLKKILNIGVFSCVLSMAIYFFKIPIPAILAETVTHLSNTTAPLSMMVIGASMVGISVLKILKNTRLLAFTGIKMLVLPVIMTILLELVFGKNVITQVAMIMLSMPVGSLTVMLASEYHGDYDTSSKAIVLTSITSILTVPLVAWFMDQVVGKLI